MNTRGRNIRLVKWVAGPDRDLNLVSAMLGVGAATTAPITCKEGNCQGCSKDQPDAQAKAPRARSALLDGPHRRALRAEARGAQRKGRASNLTDAGVTPCSSVASKIAGERGGPDICRMQSETEAACTQERRTSQHVCRRSPQNAFKPKLVRIVRIYYLRNRINQIVIEFADLRLQGRFR